MRSLRAPALVLGLAATAAASARLPGAVAAAATQARVQTAVGVVTTYAPARKSFAIQADGGEGLRFQWDSQTKFNGVVFKGAKVSVRYTTAPGGELVAQTVGVVK